MTHLAPQELRTFFVTAIANQRFPIFSYRERAELLIDVLRTNREKGHFQLHEFVVMPEHLHILLTPAAEVSLEKAVQYIKGGYSFRVKRELGYKGLVWQESFAEHRVKDAEDYERHRAYILENPVKRGLVRVAEEYPYSSVRGAWDPRPPWLKPHSLSAVTRR